MRLPSGYRLATGVRRRRPLAIRHYDRLAEHRNRFCPHVQRALGRQLAIGRHLRWWRWRPRLTLDRRSAWNPLLRAATLRRRRPEWRLHALDAGERTGQPPRTDTRHRSKWEKRLWSRGLRRTVPTEGQSASLRLYGVRGRSEPATPAPLQPRRVSEGAREPRAWPGDADGYLCPQ